MPLASVSTKPAASPARQTSCASPSGRFLERRSIAVNVAERLVTHPDLDGDVLG